MSTSPSVGKCDTSEPPHPEYTHSAPLCPASQILPGDPLFGPHNSGVAQICDFCIVASTGTSHNRFYEIMQTWRELAVSLVGISGESTLCHSVSTLSQLISIILLTNWFQCLNCKAVFQSRQGTVTDSLHVRGIFPVLTKMY